MTVPTWYELLLLALASWRTWALISYDAILDRPRRYVTDRGHRTGLQKWLDCPFCSGFWTALAWWGAYELWQHGTVIVAGAVAIAAVVPLLERLTGD